MTKEITCEKFTYFELVESICRTSLFPFAAISYLIGYASYLVLSNIILSLCIWGILTIVFVLFAAKKSLVSVTKFGPTHWTFSKTDITIKNVLMTAIISKEHFSKITPVTPTIFLISFKNGIQSRILKTTPHLAQDIISFLSS